MKRLNKDFKPSEQTYNNLAKHGAIRDFVDTELEMFMAYFLDPDLPDSKAKKSSWQMTCQRWMRSAWKGKAGRDWEYNRHNRKDSGNSGDMFGKILAGFDREAKAHNLRQTGATPVPAPNYRLPEPPEPGPAMKPEDAFAQLRNSGVIK